MDSTRNSRGSPIVQHGVTYFQEALVCPAQEQEAAIQETWRYRRLPNWWIREGDKTFPGVIFDFGKATVTVPPYLAATDGEYYYNNFSKSASSKLTPDERFNILKTFFSSDDGGRTLIVDDTDFTKNNTTDDILERLKKLKSEIIAAKREELEEQGEMEEERQKTYNKRLVDYNKL
jgi:hypothetical protein